MSLLTSVWGSAPISSCPTPVSTGPASSSLALFSFFFFFFSFFTSANGVDGVVAASPSLSVASLFLCRGQRSDSTQHQIVNLYSRFTSIQVKLTIWTKFVTFNLNIKLVRWTWVYLCWCVMWLHHLGDTVNTKKFSVNKILNLIESHSD